MKQKNIDILRSVLLILGSMAQVILGGISEIMGWEYTIGRRSMEAQTLVVPATYAFAIWGIIFLGCIIFAILHALPSNRSHTSFRIIGWGATIAFWMNGLWEVYVPLYGFDWGSLVIILMVLIPLISIMFFLRKLDDHRKVFSPILLLAGWVSVATFVNMSVTANSMDFNPFQMNEMTHAMLILTSAGLVSGTLALYGGSFSYSIAVCWGYIAIFYVNYDRGEGFIAWVAMAFGILVMVLMMMNKLRGINVSRRVEAFS